MLLLQYKQTPLHLSSESGHVDIVNVLLSHGADIHVKDGWVCKYYCYVLQFMYWLLINNIANVYL